MELFETLLFALFCLLRHYVCFELFNLEFVSYELSVLNFEFCLYILEKLHFTTLNYTSYYTLHHKPFECTFCTLNYYSCYTLHPNNKFMVNLDGNLNFMVQIIIRSIV